MNELLHERLKQIYLNWLVELLSAQGIKPDINLAGQIQAKAEFIAQNLLFIEEENDGLFPLYFVKWARYKNGLLVVEIEKRSGKQNYIVITEDMRLVDAPESLPQGDWAVIPTPKGVACRGSQRLTEGWSNLVLPTHTEGV